MGKWVSETCKICGKSEQVYRMSGEPSGYYICSQCKSELERQPKELMHHLGKSVEEKYRLKEKGGE